MNKRILTATIILAGLLAATSNAAPVTWWEPYTSDANTLGLWHFDDVAGSSGPFLDSGPGANHGTLTNGVAAPVVSGAGTATGVGMFGNALARQIGGVNWGSVPDDNVDMEYGGFPQGMTIEAWIRPNPDDVGAGVERYIAGKRANGGAWNLGLINSKLFFEANTQSGYVGWAPGNELSANTWYHVAAVYAENYTDGWNEHVLFYVNGTLIGDFDYDDNNSLNGQLVQNGQALSIGAHGGQDPGTHFRGQIDEVRYSNIVREFGPAVPEPAGALLAALGAIGLGLRRRK